MTPKRIQIKRTKGWRKPEGAVYVGRPSKWGNPFKVGRHYVAWMAVRDYRSFIEDAIRRYPYVIEDIVSDLRGHDLACFCPLDKPCHADVLLELANQMSPEELQLRVLQFESRSGSSDGCA